MLTLGLDQNATRGALVPRAAVERWQVFGLRGFRAAAGVIDIFDPIGWDELGQGVTARDVRAALGRAGPVAVTVRINSPGGNYFEGVAIHNLLVAHPAPVTVQVVGVAASAASVVAMAGRRIEMGRAAQMMIHRAEVAIVANAVQLETAARVLRQFDSDMASLYASRSGKRDAEHFLALMDAETWLSAEAAVVEGLADAAVELSVPVETAGGTDEVALLARLARTMETVNG